MLLETDGNDRASAQPSFCHDEVRALVRGMRIMHAYRSACHNVRVAAFEPALAIAARTVASSRTTSSCYDFSA